MRNHLDQYPTPPWQTWSLLKRVQISGRICEPCVGDGAIIGAISARCPNQGFITNDIDEKYPAGSHLDATLKGSWDCEDRPDWVVTNPPFNVAIEILKHAYEHAKFGVAFLLRLSFLEPTSLVTVRKGQVTYAREAWLVAHPPSKIIVLPRWRYKGNGTDSVTTAWMVWRTGEVKGMADPIEIVPKSEIV